MPQRLTNVKNKTPEITKPELSYDEGKIEFDGQTYQFSVNSAFKPVLPNGAAVRENIKVDNSASTRVVPDATEARS